MNKEIELARVATKSTFNIFSGKIISRVVGLVGGIILIRLLTPEDYGFIAIATVAPNIFFLFADFGIDAAMVKYTAEYHSKGEFGNLKKTFASALIFRVLIGALLSVLCFSMAEAFAVALGKPYMAPLIEMSSPLIFAWAINNFSMSVLLGFDSTRAYATFMVMGEISLSFMPILLVLQGMEATGAILGMVIATLTQCFISLAFCVASLIKKCNKSASISMDFRQATSKILSYGVPLAIVSIMQMGLGSFYRFMISAYCSPSQVGNYKIAEQTNALVDYIAWPISLIAFPTFSKLDYKKQHQTLNKIFKYSLKYSTLLILPLALALILLAQPIIMTLYGLQYASASIYLMLLAISWLSYGAGDAHLRKIFLSQGDTKLIAGLDALTAIIGVIFSLLLIPTYGIFGLILTMLISNWPSYLLKVKKNDEKYNIIIPFADVGRIYGSAILTGLAFLPISYAPIHQIYKLASGAIFMLVYLTCITLTNALSIKDIEVLKEVIGSLPIISAIAIRILKFLKKCIKLKKATFG